MRESDSVEDPMLGDEQLAALLDGRLDARRRSELLVRLGAADKDYEAFAETAAVLRELQAAEAAPDSTVAREPAEAPGAAAPTDADQVIPLHSPRPARRRSAPAVWIPVAAVLACMALAPLLRGGLRAPRLDDLSRAVALLERQGAPLPGGWRSDPWSGASRGPGWSTGEARAARRGWASTSWIWKWRSKHATAPQPGGWPRRPCGRWRP